MALLTGEAFDYNDLIYQARALALDLPQIVKVDPKDPTDTGVVIDNTASGPAVGDGVLYTAAINARATLGTIVLTADQAGGDAVDGNRVEGLTTVDLNETSAYIEDNNGGSSTDFVAAGFSVGGYVQPYGGAAIGNWNGFYRISGISSANGGTNNRLDLVSAHIVGTPGDLSTQAVSLLPIGAGGSFIVSGTAGCTGLMVAGHRHQYTRANYSLILRTTTNWSITTNPDRLTLTLAMGAFKAAAQSSNAVSFTATDKIKQDTAVDFVEDLGYRVGGAVLVENAAAGANDAARKIAAINTVTNPNDELTVIPATIATSAADTPDIYPLDPGQQITGAVVDFTTSTVVRTDGFGWAEFGFAPGDYVYFQNAVAGGNNDFFQIDDIDTVTNPGDRLTIVGAGLTVGTADTIDAEHFHIPERWRDDRYQADVVDISGDWSPEGDSDRNFSIEWLAAGPSRAGGDEINIGIRSAFLESSNRFNWELRGADGYVLSSLFDAQPNGSLSRYNYLSHNPMVFWLMVNGDRLMLQTEVGSAMEHTYLGYINVHGTPGNHPRPFLVGGSGSDNTLSQADSGAERSAFWDGFDACRFQWVDGTWYTFNQRTASFGRLTSAARWLAPYAARSLSHGSGTVVNFYLLSQAVIQTLDDNYELLPITLEQTSPQNAVIGDLQGMKFITSFQNTVKDTVQVNGDDYIIGRNINRNERNSAVALLLE